MCVCVSNAHIMSVMVDEEEVCGKIFKNIVKGLYFILWAISNLNLSVTFQVLYGVLLKCRWLFLLMIFSRYICVITGIARGWDETKSKEISLNFKTNNFI